MKEVKIIKRGKEDNGTACMELELQDEKKTRFIIDNCIGVPNVFSGNVMLKDKNGVEYKVAAYLFIHEDGSARITL